MNKLVIPKRLVSTLLIVIDRKETPQEIKVHKKQTLITIFGSLENAKAYASNK